MESTAKNLRTGGLLNEGRGKRPFHHWLLCAMRDPDRGRMTLGNHHLRNGIFIRKPNGKQWQEFSQVLPDGERAVPGGNHSFLRCC
jgi:hypothetical protein